MIALRCLLFVPGERPDRFDKAVAAGADVTCIDLEDAVLADNKSTARRDALDYVANAGSSEKLAIRINSLRTHDAVSDVQSLIAASRRPGWLLIPKTESADEVQLLRHWFGDTMHLLPLIETARGLRNAEAIAAAGVAGLMFGGFDYADDIGADPSWDTFYPVRSRLVNACAEAGIDCMDVPYLDVKDADGLLTETRRCKALGMTAKSAIHPAQVQPILQAYSPQPDQVDWARRVIEAYQQAGDGALLLDGKLIDAPVVKKAERIVAAATNNQDS